MLSKEREEKNHNTNAHDDDEVLKGDTVRVTILNRKTRKPSLFARWIAKLVKPVCDNFEVKSYHHMRRPVRFDVVFMGSIRTHNLWRMRLRLLQSTHLK